MKTRASFNLGKVIITPAALTVLRAGAAQWALARHADGDWGEACPESRELNDVALENGGDILSVYTDPRGVVFWIHTDASRSVTVISLPPED